MRSLTVVSVFALAALLGFPAAAQLTAPAPFPMAAPPGPGSIPVQQAAPLQQAAPQDAPPEVLFPPTAGSEDQAYEAQPQGALPLPGSDEARSGPESQYDPGDPNAATPPVDLGPDNEIAQSYDDGYDPQAYTEFQGALAPYGSWSDDPTYGNVWSPYASAVGADFVPYATCGHWLMSEYGWTWVSDWNWGWAPFHYGRWIPLAGRGWSWVPGTMWGPSWVSWRSGHGYVGWSPLPPRGARLFAGRGAGSPWRFTAAAGLGAARPSFVSPRYLPALFARTTVVANDRLLSRGQWNVHVNAGPTHGTGAVPVHLASVAPHVLPRVAVYPRAGLALSARPWARAAGAPSAQLGASRPGANGQGTYGRGTATYGRATGTYGQETGTFGQGWTAAGAAQRTVGRAPAYGPAARPENRTPTAGWSRPHQSAYGSAAPYGRPNMRTSASFAPTVRPYATPSYGRPQVAYRPASPVYYRAPAPSSYAPARSFAPPVHYSGGGGGSVGNFGPAGGSHFGGGNAGNFGSAGGSHFGGGGSHFGGGGHHR
jgi:hypothetical protein